MKRNTNPADIHDPGEAVSDWQKALRYLKAGNKRYLDNQTIARGANDSDRKILKNGQRPFAVVLTCSDSRVCPEIFFDQGPGGIFVIRNAGNIADATALGSIEFAAGFLNAPLIVVVGHSDCGAVSGAYEKTEYPERLQTVINAIHVSIEGTANLNDAIHSNIDSTVKRIKDNAIVNKMGATVVGAYYDIESGQVSWIQ